MDNYQLHCFRIAAEYLNISQAAESLHISQPSLSQTIQRLEKDLGYPLFHRSHKKITLNDSGKYLYKRVCVLEDFLDTTQNELDQMNHISKSVVPLHVSCASMLLPSLLLYLKERYPMMDFQVFQWSHDISKRNSGIWLLSAPRSDNDIVLLDEPFSLAVPADHSLARKDKIYLNDLIDESFIQLTNEWSLESAVTHELCCKNFTPNITMQFDNPALMREILQQKMGLAFIPSVTWDISNPERVVMKNVEDFNVRRKIYLHMQGNNPSYELKKCAEGIQIFFHSLSSKTIL